jgi:chemotaxis protein CheX
MDARFVNCYLVAAQHVFKTMLGLDLTMGKPSLKTDGRTARDITGIMGFGGDRKGTFAISLGQQGAVEIYRTLTGEEQTEMGPEILDAIGELTNIISGQTRKELENLGFNITAALPTVITGRNLQINIITRAPVITLPFTFCSNGTNGEMSIDFSFE